jgi:hypothetical protein
MREKTHVLLNISEIYVNIQNNFDSQRIIITVDISLHITTHLQFFVLYFSKI